MTALLPGLPPRVGPTHSPLLRRLAQAAAATDMPSSPEQQPRLAEPLPGARSRTRNLEEGGLHGGSPPWRSLPTTRRATCPARGLGRGCGGMRVWRCVVGAGSFRCADPKATEPCSSHFGSASSGSGPAWPREYWSRKAAAPPCRSTALCQVRLATSQLRSNLLCSHAPHPTFWASPGRTALAPGNHRTLPAPDSLCAAASTICSRSATLLVLPRRFRNRRDTYGP